MGAERTATFAEHVAELRRRLMWILLFVAIGVGVGYALHGRLLVIMQKPLNQTLYYTNPTGAFSFIIKVCVVFGFVIALPMALYQIFGFFEPLIAVRTRRMMTLYVGISVVMALLGMVFAYYVSLPAALHFLVNFGGSGIQSLITADEYFNFVLAYIAGFAVLFQLPLVILFINKITPLPPRKLLGLTRYVVLASFIVSAIITPTPDPFNQTLMAGPIILLFFLSVGVVAVVNRGGRRQPTGAGKQVSPEWLDVLSHEERHTEPLASPVPVMPPAVQPAPPPSTRPATARPRLVSDMVVPGRRRVVPAYQRRTPTPVPMLQPVSQPAAPAKLITDFLPASD